MSVNFINPKTADVANEVMSSVRSVKMLYRLTFTVITEGKHLQTKSHADIVQYIL